MENLEINGQSYRTGKLNAFKQGHIAKRMLPIMAAMGDVAVSLFKGGGTEAQLETALSDKSLASVFEPLSHALARLSDEDQDAIFKLCLAVTARKTAGGFSPVVTPNGDLLFEDMDLQVVLKLVSIVVKENLSNFFRGSASGTSQAQA